MPFGDGTGPVGKNAASRRGAGVGSGRGKMGGSNSGAGPGGYCVCPQCGVKVSHQQGTPCYSITCPQCGTRMTRA